MSTLTLKKTVNFPYGLGFVSETGEGYTVYSANTILDDKQDGLKKRKIGISLCSGCSVGCSYCFTNNMKKFKPLEVDEIVDQVQLVLDNSIPEKVDLVKLSMKQMGDPLVNPYNTLDALSKIMSVYPHKMQYVVSTSASDQGFDGLHFFDVLLNTDEFLYSDIRLQFSMHTTSNYDRMRLHPHQKMLPIVAIARIAKKWHYKKNFLTYSGGDNRVTLNFVMIKGMEYEVNVIDDNFHPDDVFIKLNYIDDNSCTKKNGYETMDEADVQTFANALSAKGFKCGFRNRS